MIYMSAWNTEPTEHQTQRLKQLTILQHVIRLRTNLIAIMLVTEDQLTPEELWLWQIEFSDCCMWIREYVDVDSINETVNQLTSKLNE